MKKDTKIGFILTYFHNSDEGYELLKKNVEILGRQNYYFVIASHSTLPQEIQEKCDFYFYQQKNIVDDRRYSHGVAENNLIEIALKHLKSQGINWSYKVSYDIEINDVSRFLDWRKDYKYKFVSCNWGNNILSTHSFFANIDFVLNNIDFYNTIEEMFAVNNILENCWEKNIKDKRLENELFSYENKRIFYGHNKIDILFYNYNDIVFTYSLEENRFYVTNNMKNKNITNFRIFDYYSDTCIDIQHNVDITPGSTWWFVPPFSANIPNAKNGYYIEIYFSDITIRKNILIKDFDLKHPLSKKFKSYKFEEVKFNEYSDFSSFSLYSEFDFKLEDIKTYMDIGANYGMSSIPFLTNRCKVYMIDADSHNNYLLNNAFGNDRNVKIINKAIHKYDGNVSFYESPNETVVSSIEYIDANGNNSNRVEKIVECISPNTLFNVYLEEDIIDLLKIDIEGSEYDFFETITDENIQKISKFVIEYHNNEDYKVMSILKKLAKNNFRFKLSKWEKHNTNDYIVSHKMGIIYAWK
jgi:FkbM family methyltransferase